MLRLFVQETLLALTFVDVKVNVCSATAPIIDLAWTSNQDIGNFRSRSIKGTVAEQAFTLTSTQVRANNASCTNERNINYATNMRGAFTREMKEVIARSDSMLTLLWRKCTL